MLRIREATLLMLVFLLLCPSAYAGDKGDKEWQFEFTPYFWLSSLNGESTVGGLTADIDLAFSDIVDNFDVFALSGRFEAWRGGKWGFILDGTYVDLDSKEGELEIPILKIPVDVKMKQALVDFGFGYRVVDKSLKQGEGSSTKSELPKLWFDVIGGLRYNYLDQEQSLQAVLPGVGQPKLDAEEDWVEPFIGGRIGLLLSERFGLVVRGNVGGFGIGEASDLTWNFVGGIGYRPWKIASFKLAYRVFGMDYSNGSGNDKFAWDGIMHGPMLGVTFHF